MQPCVASSRMFLGHCVEKVVCSAFPKTCCVLFLFASYLLHRSITNVQTLQLSAMATDFNLKWQVVIGEVINYAIHYSGKQAPSTSFQWVWMNSVGMFLKQEDRSWVFLLLIRTVTLELDITTNAKHALWCCHHHWFCKTPRVQLEACVHYT